jgi:hypothetical protein
MQRSISIAPTNATPVPVTVTPTSVRVSGSNSWLSNSAETRRRELFSVLSTENLLKLAHAHANDEDDDHMPLDAHVRNAAVSVGAASTLATSPPSAASTQVRLMSGSLPTTSSAAFAFDRDDDDNGAALHVGSAPSSASSAASSVIASARTREELECALCFRLFYQVRARNVFTFFFPRVSDTVFFQAGDKCVWP